MIDASNLIALFRQALEDKWGYIWGTSGQVWTEAKQKAATRETTIQYGAKWIGRCVADCSGMFVWAFKQLGASIYHGSNTIWNKYCSSKGKLVKGQREDGQPIKPGTAVFLYRAEDKNRHHIGLYVGDDTVIEAKGTKWGVVTSRLNHWDEWGELKDVDYAKADEGGKAVILLKQGSSGPAVKELQRLLTQCGYGCGNIDGIFGPKTEEAVKNFQRDHGLEADGIAGEKTQDELLIAAAFGEKGEETDTQLSTSSAPNGAPSPQGEGILISRQVLKEIRACLALALQDIEKALNESYGGEKA